MTAARLLYEASGRRVDIILTPTWVGRWQGWRLWVAQTVGRSECRWEICAEPRAERKEAV